MIEVVPLGPLAKYGSLKIAARSVAEAIEGWSRQVIPSGVRPAVSVAGFDTEEELKAETTVTKIEVLPALCGGGGFFRFVAGAVLVVAGTFLSTIPGLQAVGAAVMAAGVGMMIGGIMQMFMKAPSLSKEEDPPASKYIGSSRMTTQIGTPMGMGGGRMLVGGHLLSLQVNSSDLVYGTFPETI